MLTKNIKNSLNGSEWRKWDLHFHTPSSPDYKNKSITNQNIVDSLIEQGISVVAITDHNYIDEVRIKDLRSKANDKLVILPGVEIRTECGAGENIHIIGIFSEGADISAINNALLHKGGLYQQKQDGRTEEELYINIHTAIDIIREFKGITTIHAGRKTNGLDQVITNSLEVSRAIKTDIAKHIDIFEMGQTRDFNEYKTKVFPSIGPKAMIICSDNHNVIEYKTKANLWIKADATIEGLRQAICSADSRIKILDADQIPEEPLYYIEKISSSIPSDIKIPLTNGKTDKFCFSPWQQEVSLNKGLNCVIGDRGSGKSVLLDLIAYDLNIKSFNEFERSEEHIINKLNSNGNDVENFLKIESNSNNIEYYTQNEIERIARNHQITSIVQKRIQSQDVAFLEDDIKNLIAFYEKSTDKSNNINEKQQELTQVRASLKHVDDILSGISDKEYLAFNKNLQEQTQKLEAIIKERTKFNTFITNLLNVVHYSEEHQTGNYAPLPPISKYGEAYNEAFEDLRSLLNKQTIANGNNLVPQTIAKAEEDISTLQRSIEQTKADLKEHLKKKGINDEENLSDRLTFEEKRAKLLNKTTEILQEICAQEKELSSIRTTLLELPNKIQSYRENLYKVFNVLEKHIATIGKDESSLIKFELNFDYNKANKDFLNWLDTSLRQKEITERSIIFELEKKLLSNNRLISPAIKNKTDEYISAINISGRAGECLKEYLTKYWDEFKNKYDAIFNDVVTYKSIAVLYNGKNIIDCSFGQRATATIIILLSLGNGPIIIDEPESNLGEAVIYKEVVNILKSIKTKRQIIFATHNANIVVNGDADLIIHLGKDSKIETFTIENLEHREKLYALEGGEQAFANREKRYKETT